MDFFFGFFKGQYNILDSGFADLSPFFQIAPWILLFLIPAVTMRSIAEEKRQGTLELLMTKPLPIWKLAVGKYLGCFLLILIAFVPSILYVISIYQLGNPTGNLDIGSTLGSYIALLLLGAAYTAIGVFSSSITKNQIIAFLIALFLCFVCYFGFSELAQYTFLNSGSFSTEELGLAFHYDRISKGVLDTRDVFYFLGIIALFLLFTVIALHKGDFKQKIKPIAIGLAVILVINVFGNSFYKRFDLTQDQRFTLSLATEDLIYQAKTPVVIDVLLKGDFPSEFRRLQQETTQVLEEFNSLNSNIQYIFTNPFEEEILRSETLEELQRFGLTPMEVSVKESGKN